MSKYSAIPPAERLPDWLRRPIGNASELERVQGLVKQNRLLTDGVETVLLHQPLHPLQFRGIADRPPQPIRQSLGRENGAVLAHTGRRPSRARLRVTSSAYSSSLPIGRP